MAHWTALANQPGVDLRTLTLLTDGTIVSKPNDPGEPWRRLRPDSAGSYARGTWDRLPPMRTARNGVITQGVVLSSGRLLVWGGVTTFDPPTAEIYDPVSDRWSDATPTGIDPLVVGATGPSTVLPDGRVLVGAHTGSLGRPFRSRTAIYTPATNRWVVAGFSAGEWSRTWTPLTDGSVLNAAGQPPERFLPSTNAWVSSPRTPIGNLAVPGPALRLPDGRVWVMFPYPWDTIGGAGRTAYYTPAVGGAPERWDRGPDLPPLVYHGGFSLFGSSQTCACLLPDGRLVFQSRRHAPGAESLDPGDLRFYEFDPGSGAYTERIPPAALTANDPAAARSNDTFAVMLLLPDGTVLVTRNSAAFIYDPESASGPRDAWRPIIRHVDGSTGSISLRPGREYTVYGELFSGLSEANSQPEGSLATNYPLVRIQYDDGAVAYWRTYDISSRALGATGVIQTFKFVVPPLARLGHTRLTVVTNAIPSIEVDARVELLNRHWLPESLYREDALLIGNLADGGYIVVHPGGRVGPIVGPWDPTVLNRLEAAVKDLRATALQSCGDWKRVAEIGAGASVTIVDDRDLLREGTVLQLADDLLTIEVKGDVVSLKREQVKEVYISLSGSFANDLGLRDGRLLGSDVLVYRRAAVKA